jgi:hypothetical protein
LKFIAHYWICIKWCLRVGIFICNTRIKLLFFRILNTETTKTTRLSQIFKIFFLFIIFKERWILCLILTRLIILFLFWVSSKKFFKLVSEIIINFDLFITILHNLSTVLVIKITYLSWKYIFIIYGIIFLFQIFTHS